LRRSPRFQHIVDRVHAAGPRPTAELLVEMLLIKMLDYAGADPAVLERLHCWGRIDPETVRRLCGDRFPRPALDLVPQEPR
jgi:hypothetical protein